MGSLSGLLLNVCLTIKADTSGQLPSIGITARELVGVEDLKLLMATIGGLPAYDQAQC